ncbi:MAG: glutathione S-transferase family protein [Paracoccus sp. (in: a-proteobacteria)]|nr:glutathione S-transferase family protein [Paracoccus sp. (in: a-proteobacteria)]
MSLTITTLDWVPDFPRGYVKDLRARWACREAGLDYEIATVPADPKSDAHLKIQPFHQVPILQDDGLTLFESGAIVLHLAGKSPALMPEGEEERAHVTQWIFAALSSIEPPIAAWVFTTFGDAKDESTEKLHGWMHERLGQLDAVLAGRDYLVAGRFTAADLMVADVVRLIADDGELESYPALTAYVDRMTARPAFREAYDEQIAHWEKADELRADQD